MSLKLDIFADYEASTRWLKKANWLRVFLQFLKTRNLRGVVFYRLGHRARIRGWNIVGGLFERCVLWFSGAEVSTWARIGPGLILPHPTGVVVGTKVRLGQRVRLMQDVTLGGAGGKTRGDDQTQPYVGDDVLIGAGAKVMGPVQIGNRVNVGANAVVIGDLPDDCVAIGVPARIVKIGDRRVGLLEQPGELSEALRGILDRLEALEQRYGGAQGGGPGL